MIYFQSHFINQHKLHSHPWLKRGWGAMIRPHASMCVGIPNDCHHTFSLHATASCIYSSIVVSCFIVVTWTCFPRSSFYGGRTIFVLFITLSIAFINTWHITGIHWIQLLNEWMNRPTLQELILNPLFFDLCHFSLKISSLPMVSAITECPEDELIPWLQSYISNHLLIFLLEFKMQICSYSKYLLITSW